MDILKDQAEKLGIFNLLLKEIQIDENNENKMKSPKDNVAIYLKKKEDEKNKIEVIINFMKENNYFEKYHYNIYLYNDTIKLI